MSYQKLYGTIEEQYRTLLELKGCVNMISMGGGHDATEMAHSGVTQPLISMYICSI